MASRPTRPWALGWLPRRRCVRTTERRNVRGVDLVAVDRVIADLELLVGEPERMNIPTTFSRMNVMIPLKTITNAAVSACQRSSVQLPCTTPEIPGSASAPPPARQVLDDVRVGEDADEETAHESGDPVRIDHPQRVVHVSEDGSTAEEADREPHDRRGDDADRDRAPAG